MKKNFTLLSAFLFLLTFGVNAQHEIKSSKTVYAFGDLVSAAKTTGTIDTLDDHRLRASGFTIFGAPGGYVFGLGSSGGMRVADEVGMHFDGVGNANIVEVNVWIAAKQIIPPADVIQCRVYEAFVSDSMPATLKGYGTSNMAFVDTSSTVNFGTFSGFQTFLIDQGSNNVTTPFFVSINFEGSDDTLGIVSNQQGDGNGEIRARMLLSTDFGGGWIRMADFWSFSGVPMNSDPMIIPVVDIQSPVSNEPIYQHNLSFYPAYPNPANEYAMLRYELKSADQFELWIYDAQGRTVYQETPGFKEAGEHEVRIDLSGFASGKYYYQLKTSEATVTSRFVVTK